MHPINLLILFVLALIQQSHSSCLRKIISHQLPDYIKSASISKDGNNIVSCGRSYYPHDPLGISYWKIGDSKLVKISNQNKDYDVCMVSEDKSIILALKQQQLTIYNSSTMSVINQIHAATPSQKFYAASLNKNANLIIVSDKMSLNVKIIDWMNSSAVFNFMTTPPYVAYRVKFRSDNGFAVVAGFQFIIYNANFTLFHSYNRLSNRTYKYVDLAFCGDNEYPLILLDTLPRKLCQSNNGPDHTWNCKYVVGNIDSIGFATSDLCDCIVVQGVKQFEAFNGLVSLNESVSQIKPVGAIITRYSMSLSQDGSKIALVKDSIKIQIYENLCCHPSKFNSFCQQLCTCNTSAGLLFNGCQNLTEVLYDFQPLINSLENFTGICSYSKSPLLSFVDSEYEETNNSLTIKIGIIPALAAFDTLSMDELISLFKFDNQNISITEMKYNYFDGQFDIICKILANITEQITIKFDPMNSALNHFFATHQSTLLLSESQIPYPLFFNEEAIDNTKNNNNISKPIEQKQSQLMTSLNIVAYLTVGLGLVSFISGLFLKRLEGLETIILIQFCWIALLWADTEFSDPFQLLVPLKFSVGYNVAIFTQAQTAPIRLPFANQTGLNVQHFLNNYNLCLIIQIIPMIVFLVTSIKMKLLENQKQKTNKESSSEIGERIQKVINVRKFATHCILYCSLFNLLSFILSFIVFILFGDFMKIANWIALAFTFVIFIGALIGLFFVPTSFSTFWQISFRPQKIYLHHYFLHVFILSSSLSLLALIPQLPYISGIPLIFMVIYTLAFRPYIRLTDNIRSSANYLIMTLVIALVSFLQQYWKVNNSNPQFLIYIFIVLLCLLPLLVILSLISQIFYWYYDNIVQSRIEKNFSDTEMSRVLFDLSTAQVNLKSKNLQEKNIFKLILNKEQTLKNASNQLKKIEQNIEEEGFQTQSGFNTIKKVQSPHSYQKQRKFFQNQVKQKNKLNKNEDYEYYRMESQAEKQDDKSSQYAPNIKSKAKDVLIQQNRFVNLRHTIQKVDKIMKNGNTQEQNQFLSIYENIGSTQ